MLTKKWTWLCLTLIAAGLLSTTSTGCQTEAKYPAKPINMVMYLAAGAPVDIQIREAARIAEKILKVAVPVENRTGGSGLVALSHVKSQPTDGYTVAVATRSLSYTLANPQSSVKVGDFDWFIRLTADPTSFLVRTDGPFKTLEDVISYAKQNPGGIKVGGALSGGFNDGMMNKFSKTAGIQMSWVAFEGGSQAVAALAGGHVDAAQMTPATALSLIKEGRVKALAVSSDRRLEFLPDVPTFKEMGVDMVELLWRGLFVRKGTSSDVVKTLHDTFKQVMDAPEWKDYVQKNWQSEAYLGTADFNASVARETEEAAVYLKEIGLIK